MSPIVMAVLSFLAGLIIFGLFFKILKKYRNTKDYPHNSVFMMLPVGLLFLFGSLAFLSQIDDRVPYKYPIVDRMDINGQYEYIDVWEHPKTKCRYLIHKTRLSTSKPEINILPNGKPDCPANR